MRVHGKSGTVQLKMFRIVSRGQCEIDFIKNNKLMWNFVSRCKVCVGTV